jgi:hypothetical protein
MRTDINIFLERAREVHGNRYDYSKVVYETTEKKVRIICQEHGEFLMRPRAHYADLRGCPDCKGTNKSGFSTNSDWANKKKTLYLIELWGNGERFLKIGVTIEDDIEKRFQKGQLPNEYNYKQIASLKNSRANNFEKELKSTFSPNSYLPKISFKGASECFNIKAKSPLLFAYSKLK